MSTYEVLLFGHLLFVVAWVGTDVALQVLSFRTLRAGPERTVQFTADVEWLGTRLLVPSSLLVIVFGILLTNHLGFDFSDAWIVLAFAGFAASFVAGAGYLGPETGRISKLAADRGVDDPDVQARIRRVLLVSRIELMILIALILDMVVKPGL
jgi:uncharacterized membrane protein